MVVTKTPGVVDMCWYSADGGDSVSVVMDFAAVMMRREKRAISLLFSLFFSLKCFCMPYPTKLDNSVLLLV